MILNSASMVLWNYRPGETGVSRVFDYRLADGEMPVGMAAHSLGCGTSSPDTQSVFISSAKPPCG
jgi:hypothetical protein